MERRNIYIIIIIIILIIGIGVGVTLYEQQQVKSHLIQANDYHTQIMAYNPQFENSTLKEQAILSNKTLPLELSELKELRAANTLFASSDQKDYINAAIQINTENTELDYLTMDAVNTTNIGKIDSDLNEMQSLVNDSTKLGQTRDSILAAHPEDFGFNITTI